MSKRRKENGSRERAAFATAIDGATDSRQLSETQEQPIKVNSRLQAELNQVPMLVDLAEYGLEQGMSVVIILNFLDSVLAVSKRLSTSNTITGADRLEFRQALIHAFNADEEHLIVMTVRVGGLGVGISLHGGRPRVVFASGTRSERRELQ